MVFKNHMRSEQRLADEAPLHRSLPQDCTGRSELPRQGLNLRPLISKTRVLQHWHIKSRSKRVPATILICSDRSVAGEPALAPSARAKMPANSPLSSTARVPLIGTSRTSSIKPRTSSRASAPIRGSQSHFRMFDLGAIERRKVGVQQRFCR